MISFPLLAIGILLSIDIVIASPITMGWRLLESQMRASTSSSTGSVSNSNSQFAPLLLVDRTPTMKEEAVTHIYEFEQVGLPFRDSSTNITHIAMDACAAHLKHFHRVFKLTLLSRVYKTHINHQIPYFIFSKWSSCKLEQQNIRKF